MLEIKTQGGINRDKLGSGWRYSPKQNQEQVLALITHQFPKWIIEEKPLAVWWQIFNKKDEEKFIKLLSDNGLYINDKELEEQIALVEEVLNEE